MASVRFGRAAALATIAVGILAGAAAADTAVRTTSYVTADGQRVLQHQVDVDATPAVVWRAFTTSEGLRGFVAPIAAIDFRVGGLWEATYNPAGHLGDPGNILNEVVTYLPGRMLTIRIARTPPGFPHPELAKRLWTVIEIQDLGSGRSRVVTSMCGWGEEPDWDPIYRLFEQGNTIVSEHLAAYLAGRPIAWK